MKPALILASSSSSRQTLMRNAGLEFTAQAADIDERLIEAPLQEAGSTPDQTALELAKAKALAVSALHPTAIVIGCDQTMSLGPRIYHKPKDMAEAAQHLLSLSGKTHRLNSAAVIAQNGQVLWQTVAHANLSVRQLSEDFVATHLERVGDKALTSVGAYQLEGEGIQLFTSIDGDYFTILGLPLLPLLEVLRKFGVINV
ncbi:Maf-like protein [Agrobacterium sp.]|uniref:Maf-like protein n=1 Tax=Agrobacterium sp. TaxID=361 RepID=UPI0028AC8190|nr:Maf-like protein [Agrobacterium sp.]